VRWSRQFVFSFLFSSLRFIFCYIQRFIDLVSKEDNLQKSLRKRKVSLIKAVKESSCNFIRYIEGFTAACPTARMLDMHMLSFYSASLSGRRGLLVVCSFISCIKRFINKSHINFNSSSVDILFYSCLGVDHGTLLALCQRSSIFTLHCIALHRLTLNLHCLLSPSLSLEV
jgi:hypothetical protein